MTHEPGSAEIDLLRLRSAVRRIMRCRSLALASLPILAILMTGAREVVVTRATTPSYPLPLQTEPARIVLPHPVPSQSSAPTIPGWQLVWDSDFRSESGLSQWNVVRWAYPYSGELQYFLPQNVQVAHGMLVITARRQDYFGKLYTSGMITSQGKFSILYGKILVRARLANGQGLWPAVWMLPEQGGTTLPELDIVEEQGAHPTTVWMSQHWQITRTLASDVHYLFTGPKFSTGFHTFGITWTPGEIFWSVDGVVRYARFDHIPHVPMYLIANLAIGGNYPGQPTDRTVFPQSMDVQWVRAYRLDPPRQAGLKPDRPE